MPAEINVNEAHQRHQQGAVIIDVRETEEYASGHAQGAINIPLAELPARFTEIPEADDVLVICELGGRSAKAVQWLDEHQGIDTTNIVGGTHDWASAGFPIEQA